MTGPVNLRKGLSVRWVCTEPGTSLGIAESLGRIQRSGIVTVIGAVGQEPPVILGSLKTRGDSECQDLLVPYPSPLIYLFLSYSTLSPPVLPSSFSCLLPTPSLICYVDVFKILSVSFS